MSAAASVSSDPVVPIGLYPALDLSGQEDKIRAGCTEFERTLLRQMLREVRSGSLLDSSGQSRSYMDLADDSLIDSLVRSGGFGFGNAMAQQFLQQLEAVRSVVSSYETK